MTTRACPTRVRACRTLGLALLPALLLVLLGSAALSLTINPRTDEDEWRTLDHSPGMCAMRGVCGKRKDGDPLNCPLNAPASTPDAALADALAQTCPSLWAQEGAEKGSYCCTADQVANIATSTQKVVPFVVGCPACLHNFVQLWCVLSCSPNQATFADVVGVQRAFSNNATVVAELDYYVDPSYGTALFDSCKDVKFGSTNMPAMSFIGGGATTYQQWLDFLGLLKDKRFPPVGSPFQINFLPGNATPIGMQALNSTSEDFVACGDTAFRCSCGDCPSGPSCDQGSDDDSGGEEQGCQVGLLTCWDFMLIWVYLAGVAGVLLAFGHAQLGGWLAARLGYITRAPRAQAELQPGSSKEYEPLPGYQASLQPEGNPLQDAQLHVYGLEHLLQVAYYELGKTCAMFPLRVLGISLLLVGVCALGLLRFKVETAPERLWVGPRSQAAREAARYEQSFGPFYRVAQLILSTVDPNLLHAGAEARAGTLGGGGGGALAPVASLDTLRLVFDLHAMVDALTAEAPAANGGGPGGRTVPLALPDVCFKPFGDECATQSVAQYWRMDRQLFDKEQAKPLSSPGRMTLEYCLSHWTTECRSTLGGPMDPKLVLGGFPREKASFRNFTADSTSFIITLPLSSRAASRAAVLAWEEAFLKLARDELVPLAASHNLTLSYTAQRSVQDELSRESMADASTVAVSYGFMLAYIAAALSALPTSRRQALQVLVLTRVGLGLGGVLIVAASVVGAVGLISLFGMWSTLIIMEVIPFLVLAVGVDNMFMLVYALQRQDVSIPLVERVAGALATCGPSITLAASCEVVAFALGSLSSMPAVRNFSACAAVAVALDFILQVTAFVALLTLDTRRVEQHRADLAPCLVLRPAHEPLHAQRAYGGADPLLDETGAPQLQPYSGRAASEPWLQTVLHHYMHRVHIPLLQRPAVQAGVLLTFFTGLVLSLLALPRLSVGLDQAVALPSDSYLQQYFSDLSTQLRVGPPLYLVVSDLNTSLASKDVESVCGVSGCAVNSLSNQVAAAARHPGSSYIAASASVWVDDFLAWLNPGLTKCCRTHTGKRPSPPSPGSSPPPAAPPPLPPAPGEDLPPPPGSSQPLPAPFTQPPPATPTDTDPALPAVPATKDSWPSPPLQPMPTWDASGPSETPPTPEPAAEPAPLAPPPLGLPLAAGAAAAAPGHHAGTGNPGWREVGLQHRRGDGDEAGEGLGTSVWQTVEGNAEQENDRSDGKQQAGSILRQQRQRQQSVGQQGNGNVGGTQSQPGEHQRGVPGQVHGAWGGAVGAGHRAGAGGGQAAAASLGGAAWDDGEGSFCPAPDQLPCSTDPGSCSDCRTCITSPWPGGRPDTPDFQKYLPWFLQAKPSEACAKGGAGVHSDLVAREGGPNAEASAPPAGLARHGVVGASAFRTFYTPMNEQQDFISGLRAVRRLVERLRDELQLDVYAYSVFHVFFEQYLDVWHDAALLLGAPLLAVVLISTVLTGSVWGAVLLVLVLASLLMHLLGAMWLAGIQLNAVSLVNLAMSLGIAVEFCAHVVHAYLVSRGTRAQRVAHALEKSGASVVSGITLTKLVGVVVLAGARTLIFELYYFRLYLALVLLGAAHSLVLLPVLLALVGPPSRVTAPLG